MRDLSDLGDMRDIFTAKSSFANYVSARNSQLLSHRKIEHGLSFIWNKRIGFGWKNHIQIPKRSTFGGLSIDKKDEHLIKAVATVEPTSVPTADDEMCTTTLEYGDCQVSQFSHEDSPEIDDREKLRRMRISKANKGNVPWNKGRKHSQETLQRIRERTKLAMQDPKVKMKLVNLGHAQSEETRLKIGVGVREGWQRRREKLTVQEGCCIEWQNAIAEAARNGLAGEEELHWDSYKILDEQLMQEWLESVERRKTMPRLKGSKRAPKSPEQRRKISESISAKWADPGYRERVCSALAKYHGTPIGAERRRRRKPPTQTAVKKESVIKKPMQPTSSSTETMITKNTSKKKKNSTPSYKDPMASTKLEMIKKIKVQRAALEAKKKDAIERAKLLITEAEKAAKALEMAALKSPIARASLLETRKLIAKATKSIEGINHGQVPMQDTAEDISSGSAMSGRSAGSQNCEDVPDVRLINGEVHLLSSINGSYKDLEKSTIQVVLNGRELSWVSDSAENSTEVFHHYHSPSSESESERKDVSSINLLTGSSTVNGSIVHNKIIPAGDESLRINKDEVSTSATKTKLKWVCGKLVEVEED